MIFVIFFRFLASAVGKFLKLRPLQWPNGEFDKVNHQVEMQPSTSTRHLPNIKKIVRAVLNTLKQQLFVSLKENQPLQHFIRVLTQEKKHVRNFISKLTSFLQKLEISHYSGLRPSPSVAAVNEKFLSRFGGARFLGCKLFIKPQIDYVRESHFCATFLCLFYLIQNFQTAFK